MTQYTGIERLEHEIHRTGGIALKYRILSVGDGRDKDDRGVARKRIATHQAGDFETIHKRHLHVQQDQADVLFEQAL